MRALRAHVGAPAGQQRGAKGVPEVQESVLEHAPQG
jgi:hypothetical protein